jgi:ParB-like chromosome segregation protein Spo0J
LRDNEEVNYVINSAKEFGFINPITLDADNMTVLDGHSRLMAAKKLGMDKIICMTK